MLIRNFQRIYDLRDKQNKILSLVSKLGEKEISIKPHPDLSPISWHLLHCIYIEILWLRSKYLKDNYYKNKLAKVADATLVPLNKRGENMPKFNELILFAKKIFKENLNLLEKASYKRKENCIFSLSYLLNFINQHHAQHIETISVIKNIINIRYGDNSKEFAKEIDAISYKFSGIEIKEGEYKIGAKKKFFSFDNEKPRHSLYLKNFCIAKNPITISEWLSFIFDNGYKRKELWSIKGWKWKVKNNLSCPMNWKFKDKFSFSISSPDGFISPRKDMYVTNISKYELDAFAKWTRLRLPNEFEWEVSSKKINKKFKTWEWSANKFFGYNGFKPFPYKEYSYPWFNNNYFTLKGASIYSLGEIKRSSFRNFYKPETRYIFSGGRLCQI